MLRAVADLAGRVVDLVGRAAVRRTLRKASELLRKVQPSAEM